MRKPSNKIIILLMICIALSACGSPGRRKSENQSADPEAEREIADIEKEKTNPAASVPTAVESTPESPASVGEWITTRRYNLKDQNYATVYLRITDILRGDELVTPILKAYNNAGHIVHFPALTDDNLEYCIFKYEVMFPKKYPVDERGIPFTDLNFFIRNRTGDDYILNDENATDLSTVYDISPAPSGTLSPGDTFSDGTAVFIMGRDSHDYIIENNYYIDKECFSGYYNGE